MEKITIIPYFDASIDIIIHVNEPNSLEALRIAAKAIQREVIRRESSSS